MTRIVLLLLCLCVWSTVDAKSFSVSRALLEKRAIVNDQANQKTRAITRADCAGQHVEFMKSCGASILDVTDKAKCGKTHTGKQWDGTDSTDDKAGKVYVALAKSPAPCILGGGAEIGVLCGKLAGAVGKQCVGANGAGYNRLTLWADWSECINYQWVWCATQGALPKQGGSTFIFPGVVPSGMDPARGVSMTFLEFCAVSELCSNGDEVFTLGAMADATAPWTCQPRVLKKPPLKRSNSV